MVRSSQKSKRVSWASDINLCQIRLFLSEESPSQVGIGGEDNLQVKATWLVHSTGGGAEDQLPPGFEGSHSTVDHLKKDVSQIPLVKWHCPPKFVLNPHWQVVAGEENQEAEVQKQREMRVLEAIYPRASAIPPSPCAPLEVEDTRHCEDEQNIPLIPVTPIEDEDHPPLDSMALRTTSNNLIVPPLQYMGQGMPLQYQSNIVTSTSSGAPRPPPPPPTSSNEKSVPGVEPDVVAAASAAFTAIMKSNEQGSLIDRELLIKILSNPELIEKLVVDYGTTANSSTKVSGPPTPTLAPAPAPVGGFSNNRVESPMPLPAAPGLYHHSAPPPPPLTAAKPPMKDINYYKSLIQQHGGEKTEAQEQQQQYVNYQQQQQHQYLGSKPEASSLQNHNNNNNNSNNNNSNNTISSLLLRESETTTSGKKKRTCLYFNSSRGCKKGANCAYQHDISCVQPRMPSSEAQSSKRMKLDREIAGRT